VEPKYEKKLETLDELLESDVVYGYHPVVSFTHSILSHPELVKFLDHKRVKEDCSDIRKCVERMLTKRDIASFIAQFFATYVARNLGTVDVVKLICSLDDAVTSAGAIVLFKKGNVLVDRFNILMRRYPEAGLLERLWTDLQHRASLRGGGRFREAASDIFFAFSLSHLMPAFVVLIVGTVLSSVVFIAQLFMKFLCKRKRRNSRIMGVRILY
jgi:hypothetical protein